MLGVNWSVWYGASSTMLECKVSVSKTTMVTTMVPRRLDRGVGRLVGMATMEQSTPKQETQGGRQASSRRLRNKFNYIVS